MQKGRTVKRNIQYFVLSFQYYYGLFLEKLLTLKFHAKFIIKHKELPKKMSSEQIEQLKKFQRKREDMSVSTYPFIPY